MVGCGTVVCGAAGAALLGSGTAAVGICGAGAQEIKTEINITYVHQSRLMVTGNAMAWHNNLFTNYFDCNVVLDVANRGNVPN